MVFEAFEDVAEHLPASSRRSTTIAGFIRHSAIYARNSLRTNTSGSLANPQPDLCPPSGVHSNLATDFSAFVTIRLKRAAAALAARAGSTMSAMCASHASNARRFWSKRSYLS